MALVRKKIVGNKFNNEEAFILKRTFEIAREFCRTLRKNQTHAERILWENLRNRNFAGQKILRQHPIFFIDPSGKECFYIADFYCHDCRLVIELDGHNHFYQQDQDQERTNVIEQMGCTVIRFRNEEIEMRLQNVLKRLKSLMNSKTSSHSNSPSLHGREGGGG